MTDLDEFHERLSLCMPLPAGRRRHGEHDGYAHSGKPGGGLRDRFC